MCLVKQKGQLRGCRELGGSGKELGGSGKEQGGSGMEGMVVVGEGEAVS